MLKMLNRSRAVNPIVTNVRHKLLMVDDNPDDLKDYCAILCKEGYDVQSEMSFAEGVARLDRDHYDLVIVGQGSCYFEGRTVLASALKVDRHTPVLVVTASANMPAYMEAMQMGAFDYVEKPLAPSELVELVSKHLRPRDPRVIAA
jgi:DNA-binding NtrC family response regulator